MSQLLLIAYDVACDKRRARLHALLLQYAVPVQKSVFEARLRPTELRELIARIRDMLDEKSDQLLVYGITAEMERRIIAAGRPRAPVEDVSYFLI